MEQQQRKENDEGIMGRYGLIVAILLLFAGLIVFSAGKIIFSSEGKRWREVGEKEAVIKDRVILPNRGNIYTYDGKLLAAGEPLYGVYMDFWADGMKKDTLYKYVEDLSKALAKKFPGRSANQYRNVILNGWKLRETEERRMKDYQARGIKKKVPLRSRYVRIIKEDISYVDLKEIQRFPFFNQRSNKSGLVVNEKNARKKPFGNLATRTIGSVYKDLEKGGASGLELKYDSLLRGVPGVKNRQKIQGKWMDVVEIPAQDGYDLVTTLDADIQEITERALREKLIETEAESGTAIVMEVKTGEIKAISNLDRTSRGTYFEGNPNAFSYMNEPGSTFKTVTVMAALDDGVITPIDSFYVGNGLFQYKGRWVRDHYWRQGRDRGYLTVAEGLQISSNVVISKIALKGYENNPKKYVDAIDRIGLRKSLTWDVPLNGIEGTSVIRYPDDKNNYWSKTTLPWMSFGYETQIPPIYMLMFYNGIANGGKMIKPFIAKSVVKNGKIIEKFEAEVVNPKMCKDTTLVQIREMLRGVIENGTAKVVRSDYFPIAGKTGTAQIASGGTYSGYYVSFCGYFPADDPQYTCFVGIRRPKGVPSGGGQAGMVFKNIAEQIYTRNARLFPENCKVDSTVSKFPPIKNGNRSKSETVMASVGLKMADNSKVSSNWVQIDNDSSVYQMRELAVSEKIVPNVWGMGARDAVYLLEKAGMRVNLTGEGKVVAQSLRPGSKVVKGTTIRIVLQ